MTLTKKQPGFWKQIDGSKTFIVAGIVAAATFAKMVGWIDNDIFVIITGFLASLGLYTIRDSVRKLEE